jgi:hypothetical protein
MITNASTSLLGGAFSNGWFIGTFKVDEGG